MSACMRAYKRARVHVHIQCMRAYMRAPVRACVIPSRLYLRSCIHQVQTSVIVWLLKFVCLREPSIYQHTVLP